MLVDDHPVVREGIAQIIEDMEDFTVALQLASAIEAIEAVERVHPDIVIADISLPGKSGLELIKDLLAMQPDLRILVLSMHDESLYAERVLKAGALGYITKDQPPSVIRDAVRDIAKGRVYLSSTMASTLLSSFSGRRKPDSRDQVERLSDRQLEIFQMIGRGLRTKEIASHLNISVKTVETHRDNIRERLGLRDSYALRQFAAQWEEAWKSNP